MRSPFNLLLLAVLLPLQALAAPFGVAQCRRLREHRDQLASEAMQAEIALVQATRRRLCPQLEALAERANVSTNINKANNANANINDTASPGVEAKAGPGGHDDSWADAESNANAALNSRATRQDGAEDFDYTTYLECRRRAEQQLRRGRVILYTNQRGFLFYTLEGARLARQADAWQMRLREQCVESGGG